MKHSIVIKIMTILLTFVMFISSFPIRSFALGIKEDEELYIKEIKVATGSKSDAKTQLEEEGFIFIDKNLNAGTGQKGVYLGFITTTDPDEAIYDIQLMNMNGGYTMTNKDKAIEAQRTAFTRMATDLNYLIEEFEDAYKAGTVPAQKAYKALNFFRLVENEETLKESNGLGYSLSKGNMSIDDLTEIILFCDTQILDSVVSILTMGIMAKNENWVKKLSNAGPYETGKNYGADEDELRRRANELLPILQIYATSYNTMAATGIVSGEFNENFEIENTDYNPAYDVEASDSDIKNFDINRYKSYKAAFDMLAEYSYGDGTLKDFFSSLENVTNSKQLYPLVSVLTDGEFAAMSYGCLLELILGAEVEEDDFAQYDEVYALATEEVSSYYLYTGVDDAMTDDDAVVAFTEEANRHMAATGELEFYEKKTWGDDVREAGHTAAVIVGAIGLAVAGAAKIAIGVTMAITGTWKVASLVAMAGKFGAFMKVCACLSNPIALLVIAAVALTVAGIFYLVAAIDEWINGLIDWDDYPIPDYIYDVKDVTIRQTSENDEVSTQYFKTPVFVYYEVVRDINGKAADLNARSKEAKQWVSMYVSYDVTSEDSKPVKADDFLVVYGDGQTPEGYKPVCEFGEIIAKDLNEYDEENNVNGIYCFFKTNEEIAVESGKTYYISDVYLQAGESTTHCMRLLENAGYTPINVNLTPDYEEEGWFAWSGDEVYTYIGYKLTTNKNNALRDIRLAFETKSSPYNYGGATYAECGSSAMYTLYATKFSTSGTPILAGSLTVTQSRDEAPIGYEPVNLFSGGGAVSLNHEGYGVNFIDKSYYLYFLPETTFTEGEKYLSGITYMSGSGEFMVELADRKEDVIKKYLKDKTGEDFPMETDKEKVSAAIHYTVFNFGYTGIATTANPTFNTFIYSETYNPYRAIYDIKATKETTMPSEMVADNLGYVRNHTFFFSPFSFNGLSWDYDPDIIIDTTSLIEGGIELDSIIYLAGNPQGNTYSSSKKQMSKQQPILMSEFFCLPENVSDELIPDPETGIYPVTDMYVSDSEVLTIKNHCNDDDYKAKNGFNFYIRSEQKTEYPYVSGIYSIDTASAYRMYGGADSGITADIISRGMAMYVLASMGADVFCPGETKMKGRPYTDIDNKSYSKRLSSIYFGFEKTEKASDAYRDLFLYYNGFTTDDPPEKLYRGSVKYDLVCEIPYNFTGNDAAAYPGVYLYATKDKDAGERIIDFKVSDTPFMEGYETIRTMNGRSLAAEIEDSLDKEYKKQPTSDGRFAIKRWQTFFDTDVSEKDQLNAFFYLHIKREGDSPEQLKPYIDKLYIEKGVANGPAAIDKLFDQGADSYLEKELNSGTVGHTIYLGYSHTENPDDAITDIRAFHKDDPDKTKKDKNDVVYNLVKNIDLNDGCGFWSDYIYLYYTKDSSAGTPISEIETSSKVVNKDILADNENESIISATLQTVKKWNSNSYSDLNEDAGGDYIYIVMTRPTEYPAGTYTAPDYGNNKTYTRKAIEGAEEGPYIAALYVMDKNTLRQEKLAQGTASDKCNCNDISDQEVYDRLTEMGATTIVTTAIRVRADDYGENNNNKVFIGYSRTDNLKKAIKGIAIGTEILSSDEPEEKIYVNKKSYTLVAEATTKVEELPKAINLIGLEDTQDSLTPRMYLYTSTSGDEPIYDICIDKNAILNGWGTTLSQNGKEPYADLYDQANAFSKSANKEEDNVFSLYSVAIEEMCDWGNTLKSLFKPEDAELSSFYIHYNKYDDTIEKEKPYIGEIFIEKGDSKREAMVKLLEHNPDGYINCDLNRDAGGNYVYMAYKRTANESSKDKAVTNLVVSQGKNPSKYERIATDTGETIRYQLVSTIDLNDDAGGKYLYLYSTTDVNAGEPIIGLRIHTKTVTKQDGGYEETTVRKIDNGKITGEKIDLNKGAGGDYLYLIMKREVPVTEPEDTDTNDDIVIPPETNLSETEATTSTTGSSSTESTLSTGSSSSGSSSSSAVSSSTDTTTEPTTASQTTTQQTQSESETTTTPEQDDASANDDNSVHTASILNGGSIILIVIFAGISILTAIIVLLMKKKNNSKN